MTKKMKTTVIVTLDSCEIELPYPILYILCILAQSCASYSAPFEFWGLLVSGLQAKILQTFQARRFRMFGNGVMLPGSHLLPIIGLSDGIE